MNIYQRRSDEIFRNLEAGKISRREFYNRYNELYATIPEEKRKGLKRRMDCQRGKKGRCLGQFALDIYDTTKREKVLVQAWGQMVLECRLFLSLTIRNTGVENSGRLLIDSNNGKPDYEIEYQTHHSPLVRHRGLEVKFTGQLKKLTYKTEDLNSYIRDDALMLTIISDGMVGPNGNPDRDSPLYLDNAKLSWCVMNPTVMRRLLREFPIVHRFEMGNKACIQLQKTDFEKYIQIKKWGVK